MTSNALSAVHFAARAQTTVVRFLPAIARGLLGICFFVFGLNGFLNFIPPPAGPMPEGAVAFGGALMQTGYMFPLIKGTEVLGGALLLGNRFVPLALAVLAPVVVNIFLFHAFLTPREIGMAAVILALHVYLAWMYRGAYRPMLAARATAGR
jgi:uncharacterized membrane protein YphA (DoxX/SURF4 family)